MTTATIDSKSKNTLIISSIVLLVTTLAIYSPALIWLVDYWVRHPEYLHGFLVPVFSAFLLWDRRDMLKLDQLKGSYWGVPVVLGSLALAMFADFDYTRVIKCMTLVPMLGGLVLLVGGWHAIHWSWSAIAFLGLMMPVPGRFSGLLSQQLQAVGTSISVFVLQTLGLPAIAEGNVIVLSKSRLGVVEACSGLRMLILFFAACIGAAFYLRNRDIITRVIIGLSAIPIAIIANVARITITAFLYENVSQELGDKIFHDLAGWLMMPLAIALVWLETAILDRLFIKPEREMPVAIGPVIARPITDVEQGTRPPANVRSGGMDR